MTAKINKVWFDDTRIFVELNNQVVVGAPVARYPNLNKGTPEQWKNYELWSDGTWLHWEELDEDLSADSFLRLIQNTIEA